MSTRASHLQFLRRERHPLVAFTTLAFVMRLCAVILATALSPESAAAAGLTSLCQPSGQQQSQTGQHDPLSCQCGPVCAHGCTLGPCLAGDVSSAALNTVRTEPARPENFRDDAKAHTVRKEPIRGPPSSLV